MRPSHSFISFILLLFVNLTNAQGLSDTYLQEIKTDIHLPEGAENNVIKLFNSQNTIIAVTVNGVYRYSNETWTGKAGTTIFKTAVPDNKGEIWLATSNFIQNEKGSEKFLLPEWAKNDTILSLFWESQTLHVGTTSGMRSLINDNWQKVSATDGNVFIQLHSIKMATFGWHQTKDF